MVVRLVGLSLTGLGILFMSLGVLLFFNRTLLLFANALFIPGVILVSGLDDAMEVCSRKGNRRASAMYAGGLALAWIDWEMPGTILIIVALFQLTPDFIPEFLPTTIDLLRWVPLVGPMLANALGSRLEAQQREAGGGEKKRKTTSTYAKSLLKSLLSPQSRTFLKNMLEDD